MGHRLRSLSYTILPFFTRIMHHLDLIRFQDWLAVASLTKPISPYLLPRSLPHRDSSLNRWPMDGLLKVLDYPFIPIHNNAAEIAIREGVIKRKISYGTRSELGKRAWENMFSIMDTCRKQEVNFFHYLNGMFSSRDDIPKLANLIYNTGWYNILLSLFKFLHHLIRLNQYYDY